MIWVFLCTLHYKYKHPPIRRKLHSYWQEIYEIFKIFVFHLGDDNLKDEPNNVVKYEIEDNELNNDTDEDLIKEYIEDSLTDR